MIEPRELDKLAVKTSSVKEITQLIQKIHTKTDGKYFNPNALNEMLKHFKIKHRDKITSIPHLYLYKLEDNTNKILKTTNYQKCELTDATMELNFLATAALNVLEY